MDILVICIKIGRGISSTISMSNTMKIMASRKNRMENGTRALWLGSNPHSNGEDFSRFDEDRIAVIHAMENTIRGRIIAILDDVVRSIIN